MLASEPAPQQQWALALALRIGTSYILFRSMISLVQVLQSLGHAKRTLYQSKQRGCCADCVHIVCSAQKCGGKLPDVRPQR